MTSAPRGCTARAEEDEEDVDIYFGAGNFSRLQHEFVLREALALGRRGIDITAIAGYAGGTQVGPDETVCGRPFLGNKDYAAMGHAQVVRVSIPQSRVVDFAKLYFDMLSQRPEEEQGAAFRPLIGIRRGLKSPYIPRLEEASAGKVKLTRGKGNEPDGFGDDIVYVYDDRSFPFRAAEDYNQFQDHGSEKFSSDYKELYDALKTVGKLSSLGCV